MLLVNFCFLTAVNGEVNFWLSLSSVWSSPPFCPTGMFAIRADHDYVTQEDFMKAVRKVADSKKLESKLDYKPV